MVVSILLTKLKSVLLFVVHLFQRALCCFRRRRKLSMNAEPLSHIVVNNSGNQDMEQWNDWEFKNRKPSNVQEHIEYYRQQQGKLLKQTSEEEMAVGNEMDLFEDMTPNITKQQKLLVGKNVNSAKSYSLDVQYDDSSFVSNELENWDENSGWDKDDFKTQELLRQKTREQRQRRMFEQQQKRMDRNARPALGAKISA